VAPAFNLRFKKPATSESEGATLAYGDDIRENPATGWISWIGALVAGLVAALLRIPGLGTPRAIMFDETYYVKDGLSLVNFGYEQGAVQGADATLLASGGHNYLGIFNGQPSYIVHPPLGKLIIGYGQQIFGATPFGWRFPMAILGILSVIMTVRITRRLTNSELIGTTAGLLLALDGLHITMSRTALLDTPLSFFALAAFGCLILDRDFVRDRMRDGITYKVRWWRWAMAFTLGLACATKWSGLYFAVAFGALMLFWDYSLRKQYEPEREAIFWLKRDVAPALLLPVVIVSTYLASWVGWFRSTDAWDRQWSATNGGKAFTALRSLWHYHAEMLSFHTHLTTAHNYKANPWTWPLMIRPTSFYYGSDATCGAPTCSQEVVPLGNPLIWWGGVAALAFLGYLAVRRRNSAALPVLVAFAAGWIPWLFFPKRTTFSFYSVAFIPYTVMACAIALYYITAAVQRRSESSVTGQAPQDFKGYPVVVTATERWFLTYWPIVIAVTAVALLTWYFYPLAVGQTLPYEQWHSKMWLKSWI